MDFFERQDQARRSTKWLVLYFVLAVAGIMAAVYVVAAIALFGDRPEGESLWNAELFAWVCLGTLTVVFFGSLFKIVELRQGGGAVAMMLGGIPLDRSSREADHQKLLNVVEEMAIASGTPVPEVYVLKKEQGINAFAAGHSIDDAAIGVTHGCMTLLDRDELQGVVAHEFSHILNGDMRLNVRLIGLVHGILCIALIGRGLMRVRGRDGDGKANMAVPLIGLGLLGVGSVGVFFGRLIKSAVSRQREYLADASAVQFTRNPLGLAGALKKIGGYAEGSRVENVHAEEVSHMFFSKALGASWAQMFATHPPLAERIRLLDPQFDGKYPRFAPVVAETRGRQVYDIPIRAAAPLLSRTQRRLPADQILARVGRPGPGEFQYAAEFLTTLPEELRTAAHEPMSAGALIYALLLSPDVAVRTAQFQQLQSEIPAPIFCETTRVHGQLGSLPVTFKLPLLSLALPTLAQFSVEQYEQFQRATRLLVECDKQVDLFEYTLQKMVARHLKVHFQPAPPRSIQYYSLRPLLPDCAVLLSALARLGHDAPAEIGAAFDRGAVWLGVREGELVPLELDQCGLMQIDSVLDRLAQASPAIKKRILDACAHTVALDGLIKAEEAELLRAIAETLECPIPPFIQGV